MYQADPEWDIPAAANLTEEQHARLMSTDIGHTNENGKFDSKSVWGIRDDPVARNTFRGRQVLHTERVFGNKMYYQD